MDEGNREWFGDRIQAQPNPLMGWNLSDQATLLRYLA